MVLLWLLWLLPRWAVEVEVVVVVGVVIAVVVVVSTGYYLVAGDFRERTRWIRLESHRGNE